MSSITLPDLEERFLPPTNWESGEFFNPESNHKIHYNYVRSKESQKTIIALPGLSEFGEKYIETARFFNDHGYNFYVIDWAYQGRSSRLKETPHRRYSDGYQTDILDLKYLIENVVKDKDNLFMLAHSMGSNVGLRYLLEQNHKFKAASFSAPLLGIQDIGIFQTPLKLALSFLPILYKKYVPKGQDWNENMRSNDGKNIYSNDPIRDKIHSAWSKSNKELRVGNVTFKWLLESLKSASILLKSNVSAKITIPTLFAIAENERLVENSAIKKFSSNLKNSRTLQLKGAKHEILMEIDDIREKFLQETLKIFN